MAESSEKKSGVDVRPIAAKVETPGTSLVNILVC
jgi:hypothetical protein